jgi:hypothetical protein
MRPLVLRSFPVLLLLPLVAASAFAQEQQLDAITQINGQDLPSDAATVYFNAEDCMDPSGTVFNLTLTNGAGVTQGFVWIGSGQNAMCQNLENRTDQTDLCRTLPSNPEQVGDNTTIFDLTLQELVDTGIADCENTALAGAPYQLFTFRNEDPGGNDVPTEGYGVAPFVIDVTPPQELVVTSALEQTGSVFTISWNSPSDSEQIARYSLYASATDDPVAAFEAGRIASAGRNAQSISISASSTDLPLTGDGRVFLYVNAQDEAAPDLLNGNEGPLSVATLGIAAETAGFCDDPNVDCSGCAVGPLVFAGGQPGAGLQLAGLLVAFVAARRRRR